MSKDSPVDIVSIWVWTKETPNYHRYQSDHRGVGYDLYVDKDLLPDEAPAKLRVTITDEVEA